MLFGITVVSWVLLVAPVAAVVGVVVGVYNAKKEGAL